MLVQIVRVIGKSKTINCTKRGCPLSDIQPITGIQLSVYKFSQNDFFRTVMNRIDTAHPFYLICRFECFGYAFLLCHSGNDVFHALVAGLIDFS